MKILEYNKCKCCKYFREYRTVHGELIFKTYNTGECVRKSPSISGFPVVFVNDYCGEFKKNELYYQVGDEKS